MNVCGDDHAKVFFEVSDCPVCETLKMMKEEVSMLNHKILDLEYELDLVEGNK